MFLFTSEMTNQTDNILDKICFVLPSSQLGVGILLICAVKEIVLRNREPDEDPKLLNDKSFFPTNSEWINVKLNWSLFSSRIIPFHCNFVALYWVCIRAAISSQPHFPYPYYNSIHFRFIQSRKNFKWGTVWARLIRKYTGIHNEAYTATETNENFKKAVLGLFLWNYIDTLCWWDN